MNIIEDYTRAWLALLVFSVDSAEYDKALAAVFALEEKHIFSRDQFRCMRQQAHERVSRTSESS